MSFGDLSRIGTNVQSMSALTQLQNTNSQLGVRQMRLATGSRLNRAEDDSASFAIAKKMESRVRGQAQALANVGDAKSMLSTAEGSLNTTMDILQTLKEKATQAANGTLSSNERSDISDQATELLAEIDDIASDTTFNSAAVFTSASTTFQVGAESDDQYSVTVGTLSSASVGGTDISAIDLSSASGASAAISTLDSAIQTLSNQMADVGSAQKRLSFKQDNLSISMNSNESARSRIADADFAKEQMEIVKLQILQQTGTSSLAQANSAPQSVLSLF